MSEHIDVMISSTARDLPDHRAAVSIAIQKSSMFPLWMETLPALDADAIKASLDMVDKAEIYIGIFAYRYGYVPDGHNISITEMEYDHAVGLKIPRLIFFMHEDHPIKASDVETGAGADKLKALKDKIGKDRVANYFKSPDDLRGQVLDALVAYRKGTSASTLHPDIDIPRQPAPYIAHAYSLLQAKGLIGRQAEQTALTDWLTRTDAPMMQVVAIGGMGKSALTWKWFNETAPRERDFAGRMWWSFYESNATWENFVISALAYTSGKARAEIAANVPAGEREDRLWGILNTQPFLLALDGLERILIAYSGANAAQLRDDEVSEERSKRKTTDPRAGVFLRKLLTLRNSRILVSTRLFPLALERENGDLLPGVTLLKLMGLNDADAVDLWRAGDVKGTREQLLPLFEQFDRHPLLIQALAGEIKKDRRARGDYDKWRAQNPAFDPSRHPTLAERQAHILQLALRGLDENEQAVLRTLAAFRMPTSQETLDALFVGEGRQYAAASALDAALTDLEDRGLVGWDGRANRYDLHPIVRGVVWGGLADDGRRGIYTTLEGHFVAMPVPEWQQVESLDDLTPAIELYHALIGLERYKDACDLFHERLASAMLYRLSSAEQRIALLELLFPDGLDALPRLSKPSDQTYILSALALGYQFSGQPSRAASLSVRSNIILENENDKQNLSVVLYSFSYTSRLSGGLYAAERAARSALLLLREDRNTFGEAVNLYYLGVVLSARGLGVSGKLHATPHNDTDLISFRRSIYIFRTIHNYEGIATAYLAQSLRWRGDTAEVRRMAARAWELAGMQRYARDIIRAARLQGEAAAQAQKRVPISDTQAFAEERLNYAITKARGISYAEEELPALVALARLRRLQGRREEGRERFDEVWEGAERGPYPLVHADALNELAWIEREEGKQEAAIAAAKRAYRLAWCDGISADGQHCYAYWWGLQAAKAHLDALGAPIPDDLPPFTFEGREPMPEVEIDPHDQYHVGDRKVEDEA